MGLNESEFHLYLISFPNKYTHTVSHSVSLSDTHIHLVSETLWSSIILEGGHYYNRCIYIKRYLYR